MFLLVSLQSNIYVTFVGSGLRWSGNCSVYTYGSRQGGEPESRLPNDNNDNNSNSIIIFTITIIIIISSSNNCNNSKNT